MKKLVSISLIVGLLTIFALNPLRAQAAPLSYDLGDGNGLTIKTEVCKVANCLTVGTNADWYSYSTTSASAEGDAGAGQTLAVKPGDTLTFKGTTGIFGGRDDQFDPIYGIYFSNDQYFDNVTIFSAGEDDLDLDENYFDYNSESDITLSEGLNGLMGNQVGSISATLASDIPDQTVITATFYLADTGIHALTNSGLVNTALAADNENDLYIRSTVRMIVENPVVVATSTTPAAVTSPTVLPETGGNSGLPGQKLPYLILSLLTISTLVFIKVAFDKSRAR